jgi:hypothetical protein
MALARDPLLRASQAWILDHAEGATITRVELEAFLAATFPDRFSPAMLTSLAQNINGTWTHSGHLRGRTPKIRARVEATPTNLAYGLFLGFLEGGSGQALLKTPWMKLLDLTPAREAELVQAAANQELIVYRSAAGVTEIRFPGWLSDEEHVLREEASHHDPA